MTQKVARPPEFSQQVGHGRKGRFFTAVAYVFLALGIAGLVAYGVTEANKESTGSKGSMLPFESGQAAEVQQVPSQEVELDQVLSSLAIGFPEPDFAAIATTVEDASDEASAA